MSVNHSQALAVGGQDASRNGSSRAPWEEAGANLKPPTPSRKPKPVSKALQCPACLQARVGAVGCWTPARILFVSNSATATKELLG